MKFEFTIEFDREADGRWIAEVQDLPGVLAYGATREAARQKAVVLAGHVMDEPTLKPLAQRH